MVEQYQCVIWFPFDKKGQRKKLRDDQQYASPRKYPWSCGRRGQIQENQHEKSCFLKYSYIRGYKVVNKIMEQCFLGNRKNIWNE